MRQTSGALRIFAYNWPMFAGVWALSLAMFLLSLAQKLGVGAVIVSALPFAWSALALLVSSHIYDRSPLLSGKFIPALLPNSVSNWATIHAGLDAEVLLDLVMPGRCLQRLDIFDPSLMTSGSISRARRFTSRVHAATPSSPTALSLPESSCDAIIVAFTAHEIRDRHARFAFFCELSRCLRPGGRVVLVEHLRNVPNFIAFGPGCLHFYPKTEWLNVASHAHLVVVAQSHITPWATAFGLEKTA